MSLAPRAALLLSLTLCAPSCALYAALDDSDVEADQAPAFDLGDDMSPDQMTDMPPSTEVYDDLAKCLAAGCEAGANLCAQRGDNRYDCRSPEQIHACAQSVEVNNNNLSNPRVLSSLEQGGGVAVVLQSDLPEVVIARFPPGAAPSRNGLSLIGQRVMALSQARDAGELHIFFAASGRLSLQRYDLKTQPPTPQGTNAQFSFDMGPIELCGPDEALVAQPYPFGLANPPELRAAALLCARGSGMSNWFLAGFVQGSGQRAELITRYGSMPDLRKHYGATLADLSATNGVALVYVVREQPSMGGPAGYELFPYSFDLSQPSGAAPQMAAGAPVLSLPNNYPALPGSAGCDINSFLGAQPPIPWLATQSNKKLAQAVVASDTAGYAIFGQAPTGMANVTYFCEQSGRYRLRGVAHNVDKGAAILLERGEGEKTISLAGFGKPFAAGIELFGHARLDLLRPIAGKFSNLRAAQVFHLGERIKVVGTRDAGGKQEVFMLETNAQARPICP